MAVDPNEYIWGLEPWQQLLIWIGSVLTYICLGGFTWALTPERWNTAYNQPSKHFVSILWPATLAGYIVYLVCDQTVRVTTEILEFEKDRCPLVTCLMCTVTAKD